LQVSWRGFEGIDTARARKLIKGFVSFAHNLGSTSLA